jgi:hypothetical protein
MQTLASISRLQAPRGPVAVGGEIFVPGDGYRYHVFKSSGTFKFIQPGSNGSSSFDYLVVAGGGGGVIPSTSALGGGGGAGGLLTGTTTFTANTSYSITVGAGGIAGSNGEDSSIGSLFVCKGGGAGGFAQGNNGGSGGGGGAVTYGDTTTPGKGVYPGSTYIDGPRQGYDGNGGFAYNWTDLGGGGGAGGAPVSQTAGGIGKQITAFPYWGDTNNLGWYAGGGAGAHLESYISAPGRVKGGGGGIVNSGFWSSADRHGLPNTGGGASATTTSNGTNSYGVPTGLPANGGSGIVLIRYAI